MKRCLTCKIEKHPLDFYKVKKSKDGLSTQCRKCRNEVTNSYKRKTILKKLYGINRDEYEELLKIQKGKCAICKSFCKKRLSVDHCHVSGKIRGLLCFRCNLGLGNFKDSPGLLKQAIKYLLS